MKAPPIRFSCVWLAFSVIGCGAAMSPVQELSEKAAVDLVCMPENIDALPISGTFDDGRAPESVSVDGCGRRALYAREGLSYRLVAPSSTHPKERSLAMKASFDLDCDPRSVSLHPLDGNRFVGATLPAKVRADGCGKQATYDQSEGEFTREVDLPTTDPASD